MPGQAILEIRVKCAAKSLPFSPWPISLLILTRSENYAMRPLVLALYPLYLLFCSLTITPSALAQSVSESQMRAANMARMQAELLNGGLRLYSADSCMHQGGGGPCLVSNTDNGYRFRFLGGAPGWASRREQATIETVVLVSPDAKEVKVEYNGPLRATVNP
jgi:hypothetical protein